MPSLFLKLDVAKAFDSLAWQFLMEVLAHHGLGVRWPVNPFLGVHSSLGGWPPRRQDLACLWFEARRPHVTYALHYSHMDVVNTMIQKVELEGMLEFVADLSIKHMLSLYAGNVVLFACLVARDLVVIKEVFDIFCEACGLKVTLQKSSIIPINCS